MIIVTLTTDFGNKDYFVSTIKAALLSELNNPNNFSIIDKFISCIFT